MGIIYKAVNIVNGKCYIGMTTERLETRKQKHLYDTRSGSKYAFHNAIRKYGEDMFEWGTIDIINNKEDLPEAEQMHIKRWNTQAPNGYNMTDGGEGLNGYKWTDTQRKAMSERMSGKNHPKYGTQHTTKTRRKISQKCGGKYKGANYTLKQYEPWKRVWRSRIRYKNNEIHLGTFEDPLSASIVYQLVWIELYGEL